MKKFSELPVITGDIIGARSWADKFHYFTVLRIGDGKMTVASEQTCLNEFSSHNAQGFIVTGSVTRINAETLLESEYQKAIGRVHCSEILEELEGLVESIRKRRRMSLYRTRRSMERDKARLQITLNKES